MYSRVYFILIVLFGHLAHAGVIELSYSYSQRQSFIDDDNFQKSMSHTGSLAWYFFELSALELSYTDGESEVSGKSATDTNAIRLDTFLKMYDASLVFTFAQKDWSFQPYIKGGAAWVDKRIWRKDNNGYVQISRTDKDETVPSYGGGFRFYLTKGVSLRAGYDRWRSGKDGSKEVWDDAIRAGISVAF
jgi:hypothetical protein